MASKIRKQLYITEAQERTLKRRARELGVSEAELTRRALDQLLREELPSRTRPGAATEAARHHALEELVRSTERLGRGRRLSDSFSAAYRERGREALYEERLSR